MRSSPRARGNWWCRVGDAAALYARLVGARLRSQLQYRASFALDGRAGAGRPASTSPPSSSSSTTCRRSADWSVHGGRLALRPVRSRVLADGPRHGQPRPPAAADPRRQLRPDARAAAGDALPGRDERLPAPPGGEGCDGAGRARLRARRERHRLDAVARRRAAARRPRRSRRLRRRLGERDLHRLLVDRGRRDREHLHLRRAVLPQYPINVYDQWLRRLLRLRRADGVRRLLPGALRAGEGGSARAAGIPAVPRAARRRRRRGRRRRVWRLRRPPLPERGRMRHRARGRAQDVHRPRASAGRLRRERRTVEAVDGRDVAIERGEMSATSARTAPASRRRSRC